MSATRRVLLAAGLVVAALTGPLPTARAEYPKEICLDWATYNPVGLLLKEKSFLEEALAPRGIKVRWVQSLGSNKALEFLNAGAIDFGSAAGAAALVARINGNPVRAVYAFSRPEWTALVTRKDTGIAKPADLKGKRVAVTRGTDPHIFLIRVLQGAGLIEKDAKLVLLQHPDGRTALDRGDVDAWAGLEAHGADGFNIMPPTLLGGLDDFVTLVLPELRRRGHFREWYRDRPCGITSACPVPRTAFHGLRSARPNEVPHDDHPSNSVGERSAGDRIMRP